MNVCLVGLVDGSTSRGIACVIGGGFVAIAAGSGAELLAHEPSVCATVPSPVALRRSRPRPGEPCTAPNLRIWRVFPRITALHKKLLTRSDFPSRM